MQTIDFSILTEPVMDLLLRATAWGFSGSRKPDRETLHAALHTAHACESLAPRAVLVGDAAGIDRAISGQLACQEFVSETRHPAALVARSERLVRALAASGGLLVAFPGQPCPATLKPATLARDAFNGSGSGTWATVALAVGLGCSALVYLGLHPVPAWEGATLHWRGGPVAVQVQGLEGGWCVVRPGADSVLESWLHSAPATVIKNFPELFASPATVAAVTAFFRSQAGQTDMASFRLNWHLGTQPDDLEGALLGMAWLERLRMAITLLATVPGPLGMPQVLETGNRMFARYHVRQEGLPL